jgi:ferredoxin--NADP+ reductase
MAVRVAVVGAGPAGFYACEDLLSREGFEVDLYDALPTPFGLVRAGVAPDHPKIKSVTRRFEKTARHPAFRFFGGVSLGTDVERDELLRRYHAVVYAVGSRDDNRLGIPGEDRPGSHAATEFVAWYNGHPEHADRSFDLSARRAVVIGNGNVALDVARMLMLAPEELANTDCADHAIAALAAARVQEVIVLGRRGPAQAAFTSPELLELGELRGCEVVVRPDEVALDAGADVRPLVRRNLEILAGYAARGPADGARRIELRFLRSPVELVGDDAAGPVRAVRVARNRIDADGRAVPTGIEESIECGLVLRAVGYRGRPLPGVPFEGGRIRNLDGRVTGPDGAPLPGEYAAGWIKRGPSGVIGTNKKDAAETIARVLEDAAGGRLNKPAEPARGAVEPWLRSRVPELVTWAGWSAIDAHEISAGEAQGRPRVKLVRVPAMLEVARA